jgi:hypothetical protein
LNAGPAALSSSNVLSNSHTSARGRRGGSGGCVRGAFAQKPKAAVGHSRVVRCGRGIPVRRLVLVLAHIPFARLVGVLHTAPDRHPRPRSIDEPALGSVRELALRSEGVARLEALRFPDGLGPDGAAGSFTLGEDVRARSSRRRRRRRRRRRSRCGQLDGRCGFVALVCLLNDPLRAPLFCWLALRVAVTVSVNVGCARVFVCVCVNVCVCVCVNVCACAWV